MQNSWCERPLMSQTDLKIWIWTQLCSIIILAVTFWPNVGVCGVLYIEALWVCFACWTYFNVYMKCYNIMLFVKIYTIYKKKKKKKIIIQINLMKKSLVYHGYSMSDTTLVIENFHWCGSSGPFTIPWGHSRGILGCVGSLNSIFTHCTPW